MVTALALNSHCSQWWCELPAAGGRLAQLARQQVDPSRTMLDACTSAWRSHRSYEPDPVARSAALNRLRTREWRDRRVLAFGAGTRRVWIIDRAG